MTIRPRPQAIVSFDGRHTYLVSTLQHVDRSLAKVAGFLSYAEPRGSSRMGLMGDLDRLLDIRLKLARANVRPPV